MWDLLSGDFDERNTAVQCMTKMTRFVKSGSLVVMHDKDNRGKKLREILPDLNNYCQERGWESAKIKT